MVEYTQINTLQEQAPQLPDNIPQATAIDFHTMYKKEIQRQGIKLDLKVATSILVYNMLQDMRHLIILDFR